MEDNFEDPDNFPWEKPPTSPGGIRRVNYTPADIPELGKAQRNEEVFGQVYDYFCIQSGQQELYIMEGLSTKGIWLDIAVIPPTPEYLYWTLATIGLSAYEIGGVRTELTILLPTDWPMSPQADHYRQWRWPAMLLGHVAQVSASMNFPLSYYTSIDCRDADQQPLPGTLFTCAWMLPSPDGRFEDTPLIVNDHPVQLAMVDTLTAEELDFMVENGVEPLLDAFDRTNKDLRINPLRNSSLTVKSEPMPVLYDIATLNEIIALAKHAVNGHIAVTFETDNHFGFIQDSERFLRFMVARHDSETPLTKSMLLHKAETPDAHLLYHDFNSILPNMQPLSTPDALDEIVSFMRQATQQWQAVDPEDM